MSREPQFVIARSLPLPGLGLLVLPQLPTPAWLAAPPLHTALRLHLHRPGYPPQPVPATVEEVALTGAPAARALLLDTTAAGTADSPAGVGAWLELLDVVPDELH